MPDAGVDAPGPARFAFVILEGPGAGEHWPLREGVLTVGRALDADICLADAAVSRYHARLQVHGSTLLLADLGSKNGVEVNGRPIVTATPLRPGDVVTVGQVQLALVEATHAAPPPPAQSVAQPVNLAGQTDELLQAATRLARVRADLARGLAPAEQESDG